MNYFEILDLRMEPFSNSPDPDFLYRSQGHERCLHELEIALRLRRGLSVVLGEVGTGKTTLCRELIRTLDEDESVTARLLLDPGFSSAHELLVVLHEIFCGSETEGLSDWQLKEAVKETILTAGLDQEKIMVLVVDEGQKMPPHCLEVLRELLNYETNDRKLLQIVIFAQSEFSEMLTAMPNLADRVNDLIRLEPLSLSETKAMVRHRLDTAKADYRAPEIFTSLGYLALHRTTGGYPRRIVRLCHKVVLGLIMKEKRKAGWKLVRACARRNELAPKTTRRWLALPVAAAMALALWFGLQTYAPVLHARIQQVIIPALQQVNPAALAVARTPIPEPVLPKHAEKPAVAQQPKRFVTVQPVAEVVPPQSISEATPPSPENIVEQPFIQMLLGQVTAVRYESLSSLIKAIYGRFDPSLLETVLKANPGMTDPNLLQVGQRVNFPTMEVGTAPAYWVQLDDKPELSEAIKIWRTLPEETKPRILPHLDAAGSRRFAIISDEPCLSEHEARRILAQNLLPGATLASGNALVRLQW
ncbi:AAA family ATPase [Desulfovibrio ferrophilus]|uniref:AAA+ ATPase domain-containing protein n=1 Tax=Desulfovibrio ferrophilus TaxID=241368 RepID=A0A2Z6AZA2_9BACT|nr:AAA family ATPase [Desulfovibrio ferrophilus]BBD08520.1 putative uncharacterized protein [Desulfovibrio ferrophilus]